MASMLQVCPGKSPWIRHALRVLSNTPAWVADMYYSGYEGTCQYWLSSHLGQFKIGRIKQQPIWLCIVISAGMRRLWGIPQPKWTCPDGTKLVRSSDLHFIPSWLLHVLRRSLDVFVDWESPRILASGCAFQTLWDIRIVWCTHGDLETILTLKKMFTGNILLVR